MSTNNRTRVKAPAKNILPQRTQGLDLPEHNDASTLNPIGKGDGPPSAGRTTPRTPIRQAAANRPDGRRGLLTAKCKIGLGTWNVRTLHQTGNLSLLLHQLEEFDREIIWVSETHWTDTGDFIQEGYQILSSGNCSTHRAGVAFILNKNAQRALLGYNPISERFSTVTIRTQIGAATIMQVYAPTTGYSDDEVEDFYDQLQSAINKTPCQDILIIMGDFNAKVGCEWEPWNGVIGKFGIGDINDRGEKLPSFCTSNSLCITNTLFKEAKPNRLWTWESPDGSTRNKIDYILIKHKWKSSVTSSRSFPSADVGSDHQLVLANIKLKLKAKEKPKRPKKYDVNKLSTPETYNTYQVTIGGKFGPLLELPDTDIETDKLWGDIKACFKETTEEVLGNKKPQQQKPWLTSEVLELSNERSNVKQQRLNDPSKKPRYNFLNREIKWKSRECKEAWLQNVCKEVEHANYSKKAKQVYSSIKTITGTKSRSMRSVKDKDGEVLTDDKRIKDRWNGGKKKKKHIIRFINIER